MKVSVLIPSYNSGPWLESAVRSAFNQTHPPLEILCVDDASANDTVQRLERLKTELGDRLEILRQTDRRGIAAARNRALERARGDWIALLDHDDLWLPEKLELQAGLAEASPDAVLLHSRCWEQTGDDASTRTLMHDWKRLADRAPFPYLFLSNFIVPCTVLVRREVLRQAGGFDEHPGRMGKDDIDLWLRLAADGFSFAHVEQPLAVRRLHGGNYSSDAAAFLQGRFDVLLEAFERDRRGARRLLVSEGLVRLLGILFDRLLHITNESAPSDADAAWTALDDLLDRSQAWLSERSTAERLAFRFPAFVPLASTLARKNRRPGVRHALECAFAARTALADAGYLTAAREEGTARDSALERLLNDAAESANRAARRAYRRRAEYEERHGKPLITD